MCHDSLGKPGCFCLRRRERVRPVSLEGTEAGGDSRGSLTGAYTRGHARGSRSPYHRQPAKKGIRGMPARPAPRKDVVHCEKRR